MRSYQKQLPHSRWLSQPQFEVNTPSSLRAQHMQILKKHLIQSNIGQTRNILLQCRRKRRILVNFLQISLIILLNKSLEMQKHLHWSSPRQINVTGRCIYVLSHFSQILLICSASIYISDYNSDLSSQSAKSVKNKNHSALGLYIFVTQFITFLCKVRLLLWIEDPVKYNSVRLKLFKIKITFIHCKKKIIDQKPFPRSELKTNILFY